MTIRYWNGPALGITVFALSACGGGGGDGAPAAPSSLTLSGTAATGAAMAGATVAAKCATGSGTANTLANGSYTLAVTGGVLPCLLKATSADGATVLHSLAEGTGSSTAAIPANVTPITELVVARVLASADTAAAFDAFTSTTREKLTTSNVSAAVTAVKEALSPIDSSISGLDPLRGSFTAATGTSSGDATDAVIDRVMERLAGANPGAASVTEQVKAFAQVVATSTTGVGTAAESFLAPPVAGCPALRNVNYRIVGLHGDFAKTTSLDWGAGSYAAAWSDSSNETGSLSFGGAHPCRFTVTRSTAPAIDGFAASSGVVVLRDPGSTQRKAGILLGFPEQKAALSDLAGRWNLLEFSNDGGSTPFTNYQAILAVDSAGRITEDKDCGNATTSTDTCSDSDGVGYSFTANADGGFNLVDTNGASVAGGRAFTFRNAGGTAMMVLTFPDGGMLVGARQVAAALPAVGTVTNFWDVQAYQVANESSLRTIVDTARITVQSVDTANQRVTRLRNLSNGADDGRVDTVNYNQPRTGLRLRAAGSYQLNNTTRNFADALQLPVQGMGLVFGTSPGPAVTGFNKYLSVSVFQ